MLVLAITASSIFRLNPAGPEDSDWLVLAHVLWLRLLLFVPLLVDSRTVLDTGIAHAVVSRQYILSIVVFLLSLTKSQDDSSVWSLISAGFSNPAVRTLSSDLVIKIGGDIMLFARA